MDCSTPGFPVLHHLQSLLKLMSIELVMPYKYFILCHPFLLLPSIFHSLRVFSNESALYSNILDHLTWSIGSQPIYTYIFLSGDNCFLVCLITGLNWIIKTMFLQICILISLLTLFFYFIFMIGFPGCASVFTELNLLKVGLNSVQSLSRVRLCYSMNRSTPGLPVHHQLLEFT